jgi:hypothetical protein
MTRHFPEALNILAYAYEVTVRDRADGDDSQFSPL